jgi:hypothetical protein
MDFRKIRAHTELKTRAVLQEKSEYGVVHGNKEEGAKE